MPESPPFDSDSTEPESTGAASAQTAYGARTARGVLWTSVANVAGRFIAFGAQWVLGYLLSENDFGVYAIALAASTLMLSLRRGGLDRLLVQRGDEFDRLAGPIFRLSLGLGVACGCALALAAPATARFYGDPVIAPLMWVIAASMVLNASPVILRAKLSIDLRFRDLATLSTGSALVRNGLLITLALAGFGPMSFVLPMLAVAVYETIHGHIMVGRVPRGVRLTRGLFRELFAAVRLLLVGALAVALVNQGDYLVLGKMVGRTVTGQYFFAFQLTAAMFVPFTESLMSVLMPALMRLRADASRHRDAYLRTLQGLSLVGAPLTAGAVLVIAPLIHVLWQGKWDAVGTAAQLLAVAFVFRLQYALAMSLIAAHGRWRRWAIVLVADAVGTLVAAALGAWLGGLNTIALVMSVYRTLVGLVLGVHGCRLAGLSHRTAIVAGLPPVLVAAGVAAAVHAVVASFIPVSAPLTRIGLMGTGFTVVYGVFAMTLFRSSAMNLLATVLSRRRHPPGTVPPPGQDSAAHSRY